VITRTFSYTKWFNFVWINTIFNTTHLIIPTKWRSYRDHKLCDVTPLYVYLLPAGPTTPDPHQRRTAAEWWDRRTDRRTPDCCVNSAPHRPTMRALPIMAADISYRFSVSAMRNEVKVICKKLLHNIASFYAVWHRVCIAIRLLCLMSFDFIFKITDIRVILVIWNRINKLKN